MACSSTDAREGGFATPAAVMISLALALTAAAATSASVMELKLARADLAQAGAEEELAGGQERAALILLASTTQGALRWSLSDGQRAFSALAEPESRKASVAAVASMDEQALAALGVKDSEGLKARLKALSLYQALGPDLDDADASPTWRACARSLISPLGQGGVLQLPSSSAPSADTPVSHAGEIWRMRLVARSGWSDDRIIRFTGDRLHPAAILYRRFAKYGPQGTPCEALFKPAA